MRRLQLQMNEAASSGDLSVWEKSIHKHRKIKEREHHSSHTTDAGLDDEIGTYRVSDAAGRDVELNPGGSVYDSARDSAMSSKETFVIDGEREDGERGLGRVLHGDIAARTPSQQ